MAAKVAITRCADYEPKKVYEAVKRSVNMVGGIGEHVKPGMRVLLKPNLLSPRPPEDAVDTHPEVVRAVARLVKESGATPIIGDSPGGYGKNVDEVFRTSGISEMADEEGMELVKFVNSRFVDDIPFTSYIFDCDYFISIPKLKTHMITTLTAAIKNTFGTVVGLYKAECHSRSPKEEDLAKTIAKVYSIAKPDLTILDGILAMEGDGPSSGVTRKMNLVMAGRDAVAIDSCIATIMGLEPRDISVTKEAYAMKLGEADMSRIEILGDDIKGFIADDFKLPQTTPLKYLPKILLKSTASFVRFKPYIDISVCKRCNLCKVSCPVDAITINKNARRIDYTKCVKCLCCHEVCPYKAISVRRNVVTRLVWG